MVDTCALKQGSPNQGTYNIATLIRYVNFCYLLEINVHDGHNTDSLQRDIVKCDTPNGIVEKSHLSTEYTIIGHDHLLSIGIGKSPTPLIGSVNSVEVVLFDTD